MKNKPLDHDFLGGKYVENPNAMPQRKPDRATTGDELLRKAVTGSHIREKTSVWDRLLGKK